MRVWVDCALLPIVISQLRPLAQDGLHSDLHSLRPRRSLRSSRIPSHEDCVTSPKSVPVGSGGYDLQSDRGFLPSLTDRIALHPISLSATAGKVIITISLKKHDR